MYNERFPMDKEYLIGSGVSNQSHILILIITLQGMVDGSAFKLALRQDTGYMVEKTYLGIAPYLGAFGAYLMPQ